MASWTKYLFGCCVLIAVIGSASSFYFEFVMGLTPCPLCVMQRFMVLLVVAFGIVACLIRRWRRLWWSLAMLACLGGIYFAGRQSYLQMLPEDQVTSCSPSLDALIKYFPMRQLLTELFWGSGSCARHSWQWLGLSMANLSLLMFVGLLVGYVTLLITYSLPSSTK